MGCSSSSDVEEPVPELDNLDQGNSPRQSQTLGNDQMVEPVTETTAESPRGAEPSGVKLEIASEPTGHVDSSSSPAKPMLIHIIRDDEHTDLDYDTDDEDDERNGIGDRSKSHAAKEDHLVEFARPLPRPRSTKYKQLLRRSVTAPNLHNNDNNSNSNFSQLVDPLYLTPTSMMYYNNNSSETDDMKTPLSSTADNSPMVSSANQQTSEFSQLPALVLTSVKPAGEGNNKAQAVATPHVGGAGGAGDAGDAGDVVVADAMSNELPDTAPTMWPRSYTVETAKIRIRKNEKGQKLVNQYLILNGTLGSGTYGKVKKAINTEDNQLYALKILNKSLLRKKEKSGFGTPSQKKVKRKDHWMSTTEREIAIMKKLDHKNVVKLYEVMDDPKKNKLYLVIEYVKFGAVLDMDMVDVLGTNQCSHKDQSESKSKPLQEDLARKYFRDIISGLDYLHKQRVVHRDIKPENLLLSETGTIKISDFGVSHLFEGDDDMVMNTAGSAAFMAPEMCDGTENFSGKMTDIWALGVTLYIFVVGALPFQAESVFEMYNAIVEDELIFPPAFVNDLSPELVDLLRKMLVKDPNQRLKMDSIMQHPWVTQNGQRPMAEACGYEIPLLHVDKKEMDHAITLVSKVVLMVKLKTQMSRYKKRIQRALMKDENANSNGNNTTGPSDQEYSEASESTPPISPFAWSSSACNSSVDTDTPLGDRARRSKHRRTSSIPNARRASSAHSLHPTSASSLSSSSSSSCTASPSGQSRLSQRLARGRARSSEATTQSSNSVRSLTPPVFNRKPHRSSHCNASSYRTDTIRTAQINDSVENENTSNASCTRIIISAAEEKKNSEILSLPTQAISSSLASSSSSLPLVTSNNTSSSSASPARSNGSIDSEYTISEVQSPAGMSASEFSITTSFPSASPVPLHDPSSSPPPTANP